MSPNVPIELNACGKMCIIRNDYPLSGFLIMSSEMIAQRPGMILMCNTSDVSPTTFTTSIYQRPCAESKLKLLGLSQLRYIRVWSF